MEVDQYSVEARHSDLKAYEHWHTQESTHVSQQMGWWLGFECHHEGTDGIQSVEEHLHGRRGFWILSPGSMKEEFVG